MRRIGLVWLVALAVAGLSAATATADDTSLKATVHTQEQRATPEANAFSRAVDAWDGEVNRGARRVQRTARAFSVALGEYRAAVQAESSSSTRGTRAKQALLSALTKLRRSLGTLDTGIRQLQAGEDGEQVKRTMRRAIRQANAARKALADAQALL
jgi:hypothetical protein